MAQAMRTTVVVAKAWRWPVGRRSSAIPSTRIRTFQAARAVADAALKEPAEPEARARRPMMAAWAGERTTAATQGSANPGKKPLMKPRVQPTGPPALSLRLSVTPSMRRYWARSGNATAMMTSANDTK